MIVHIDATTNGAHPLSEQQTRSLLEFCRSAGCDVFTVDFLYVKGENRETLAAEFCRRLAAFRARERLLECVFGNGFKQRDCWSFTDEAIEFVVREARGDLLAYDILNLPEDWLFYVGDSILLQVVSHEQEITLRLTDQQFAAFSQLGIPYAPGQPKWSGLPEVPVRTPPRRPPRNNE